ALGIDALEFGLERRAWKGLAQRPGTAAMLGLGLVALPARDARPLRRAGWAPIATLPDGDAVFYRPPMPRFALHHHVTVAADEAASFAMVLDRGFDPRATVVLEPDPHGAVPPVGAPSGGEPPVEVVAEGAERLRLRAAPRSAAVLVVADTWFPGWTARVDGVPAPILRADYALRALPLAAGVHDVELLYRPRSFTGGLALSAAALVATVALARGVYRRAPGGRAKSS